MQTNKDSVGLCQDELEQFIGECLYMSIIHLPSTRHHWNPNIGNGKVSDVMSWNRGKEIKRFLHCNDNSTFIPNGQDGHDALHKVRPLLTMFREQLLKVPREEYLLVDEQIIPIKSRSHLKHYNPNKPYKWGYKAFVWSGITDYYMQCKLLNFSFKLYTNKIK